MPCYPLRHIRQELALLHGTRRTATVSCKDAVELIAVDKEDFVQMNQLDSDEEKEHIKLVVLSFSTIGIFYFVVATCATAESL